MSLRNTTTRRRIIEALLGAGTVGALYAQLDPGAWRAYQTLEEDWIRDRYNLLVSQCPEAVDAAQIDMQLRLAELGRRGREFAFISQRDPAQLRGGVWQLAWVPVTGQQRSRLLARDPAYRRQDEQVRQLAAALRAHPKYERFVRAQTHLWKTPEYKAIHRRYQGRMKDLQGLYSSAGL